MLRPGLGSGGYYLVVLSLEKNRRTFNVSVLMAMAFMNYKPNGEHDIVVDHIDNVKTNNVLFNIQIITGRENTSKDKKNCSSKYTGVSWDKSRNKWVSNIRINGLKKNLGRFTDEIEAAKYYQDVLKTIKISYKG